MSSARVLVHYTPSKCCEHTACVPRLYTKSAGQLWSRNYCTHRLPGGDLPQQQTDNEWKHYAAVTIRIVPVTGSQLTAEELIDIADDKLFDHVLRKGDRVLHELLPERVDIFYNLRSRSHDRVIPENKGQRKKKEAEKNFVTRMLYK